MAIAFLALLAAIGGTAAALPGKNQVKKDDIAKGAVGASDLARNAVTAGKVKRNSLSGGQIRESGLGKVPLTALADNATNAGNANTAGTANRATTAGAVDGLKPVGFKRVLSSASNADPEVARAAAAEVPMFSFGQFDVYGKCYTDTTAVSTIARTFIRTRQSGSVLDSDDSVLDGTPFLDPATLEADRDVSSVTAATNFSAADADDNSVFSAVAPDGTAFSGQANVYAKNGTLPGGDGIYGAGNACVFSGYGTAG